MKKRKIVFILTHPIQYFSPLFKFISEKQYFDCEAWYLDTHGLNNEEDKQFGTNIKWDIPLLEGYTYRFVKNNSPKPGIYTGFFGLINLDLIELFKKLPDKSIVVVHGWNTLSHLISIAFARVFGHIVCIRGESPLNQELQRNKWKLKIRKFILKNCLFPFIHKFLYIGNQNKAFYEYYGVKEKKLLFTPYSVNNEYFQQQALTLEPNHARIKTELGIPKDSKVILFSGKLIDKKNPLDVLGAFRLIPNNLNAFLLFMGDGQLRTEIEQTILNKSLKNVFITGFINQTEVSKYYLIADLFIMSSGTGETWGLSTNEAMNFGSPVIISDLTGNAQDLVDGNGFIFKTNDISELADKIIMVLQSPREKISAFRKKSKDIIAHYSYEQVEASLRNIL